MCVCLGVCAVRDSIQFVFHMSVCVGPEMTDLEAIHQLSATYISGLILNTAFISYIIISTGEQYH